MQGRKKEFRGALERDILYSSTEENKRDNLASKAGNREFVMSFIK